MSVLEKVKMSYMIKNYMKIYPYIKPYKTRAVLAILITIPIGSMDALTAWLLKPYMDIVMIERSGSTSVYIPLFIILLSLFQSSLNYLATYLNAWLGNKITNDLKLDLFKKMMKFDANFFDKNTSGNIQLRFNNDAQIACNGLLSNLRLFTTRLFSSLALIFVLFYMSWQLALVAIVFLLLALYPLKNIRKKMKTIMDKTIFSGAAIATQYNEAFSGNRIITSYNLNSHQQVKFESTLESVFKLGIKMVQRTGLLSPLMHFIISIGIAGVIWLGNYLISTNELTLGGFVSFIAALLMLYTPIKGIGSNFTQVQMALLAMERVFEMLEKEPKIRNKENAIILEQIKNTIEYKNVSFGYDNQKKVLDNVNLIIKKGQTVAFVGNSGGGKTTIANLLPRFYDVNDGGIFIDGIDIRDIDLYSLRKNIAIVFQDNFLFEGSIRDNIVLDNKGISDDRVSEVLRHACLDRFVSTLELGLDTQIGERGILLSGGQKQRIAIARAFIKDAPIVILDEATSALDNTSEAVVQEAIDNLMKDRTVLIIAHRLSTIKNADNIVVVNHGKICETGNHEQLIKNNGVYASLYKI